jgi:F-type H+-transporting ATPase subunit gamma
MGLAGGYNNNVLNFAYKLIRAADNPLPYAIGKTAREYFARRKADADTEFIRAAGNPSAETARKMAEKAAEMYGRAEISEAYIVYTSMEHSSVTRPTVRRLLPLIGYENGGDAQDGYGDGGYTDDIYYDPSPSEVLDTLIRHYLTGLIHGCLIQSAASEHSSRVLAMSSATKNADEIIAKLNVSYNRARQESVTNEMIEIVTGAGAVR